MNAAVPGQAAASKDDSVTSRGITAMPPTPVKPVSFLHDAQPQDKTRQAAWAAMQIKNDKTCEDLLVACKHRPDVFSLSLLTKAFCESRRRQKDVPNNRKLHAAWVLFWNTDVLAGLVLRAQAELMYEPAALAVLPHPLSAQLTEDATAVCAAMLRLNPLELTWSALYVHFLAHVRSYLVESDKGDYQVNLQDLGKHLSAFFKPTMSREAGSQHPAEQPASAHFWSTDALALYLLFSLVKLVGKEYTPQWPDAPDVREGTPDISASNVLRSPSAAALHSPQNAPKPAAVAPTMRDAPIVLDDAESDPPHDSHWLLKHAPGALSGLSKQLSSLRHHQGPAAIAAVEMAALRMRDEDPATWLFLQRFAALPEDQSPWDAPASPEAANGLDTDAGAAAHVAVSPDNANSTGELQPLTN